MYRVTTSDQTILVLRSMKLQAMQEKSGCGQRLTEKVLGTGPAAYPPNTPTQNGGTEDEVAYMQLNQGR